MESPEERFDEEKDERAIVCAWCDRLIREGKRPVSHGICDKCTDKHFPEWVAINLAGV